MKDPSIVYGIHPLREVIRAGRSLRELYVLVGRRDSKTEALIQAAKGLGAAIHYESRGRLDQLANTGKHQGVVGAVTAQTQFQLEDLLDRTRKSTNEAWPPLFLILDEVEDPNNLGAVIRTAEAAGAHGVIIPERRSAGITPAVVKASAGAVSHLPVVRVGNLRQSIEKMKKTDIWIFGLEAGATTPYWEMDWKVPVAVIAGAEGKGLRPLVREQCDQLTSLPMQGQIGSLNVSVAVGIVLYDIVRQRKNIAKEVVKKPKDRR